MSNTPEAKTSLRRIQQYNQKWRNLWKVQIRIERSYCINLCLIDGDSSEYGQLAGKASHAAWSSTQREAHQSVKREVMNDNVDSQ